MSYFLGVACFLLISGSQLSAQSGALIVAPEVTSAWQEGQSGRGQITPTPASANPSTLSQAPGSSSLPSETPKTADVEEGQQTKRILGIMPNFEAVSANTYLPPLSLKHKFLLASKNTFDYSSFVSVAIQAGIEDATKTYPEFHTGVAAYGRYYWHTFTDFGVENFLVGAIVPAITHEDPRYYTLARGGLFHRTAYAFTRLCITKNDSGARRVNLSELLGSGMATGISSRYYPAQERGASEILDRWASQLLNDGIGNVVTEFWPDINHKFFHRH